MCICNCAVIHSKTNQILFLQNSMYTKLCTKAMRNLCAQLLLYVYIYTWSNLRMREYRELDICSWYPVPSWRLHIKCTVCVRLEQHLRLSQFMICLIDPEGKEKKEEFCWVLVYSLVHSLACVPGSIFHVYIFIWMPQLPWCIPNKDNHIINNWFMLYR